jgi:DNA polymerase-3 subunit alpha
MGRARRPEVRLSRLKTLTAGPHRDCATAGRRSTRPRELPSTIAAPRAVGAARPGVFQLEGAGVRDMLKKLRPDCFEDIIAVVSLYRPGPMENIPRYIAVKHGEEVADYPHPAIEGILRETHGIMIYQEQVMQIAQVLAGYSLGSADLLRRAMGKKIPAEMEAQRQLFIEGAGGRGVDARLADQIFDQMAKFAGYGFNKSHAAAYALVAYQTAYLKANYPVEFLAALMTLDLGNTDKLNVLRLELERLGIRLLPPDIHRSEVTFAVEPTPYLAGRVEGSPRSVTRLPRSRESAGRRWAISSPSAPAAAASRISPISRAASTPEPSTAGNSRALPRPARSTA